MSIEAARRALLTGSLPDNPTPKRNPATVTPTQGDAMNSKDRRAAERRAERAFEKTLRQFSTGDRVRLPDGEICIFVSVVAGGKAVNLERPEGMPTRTRLASLDTPAEYVDTRIDFDPVADDEPETEDHEDEDHTHEGDAMTTTTTTKRAPVSRAKWTKQEDLDLLLNTKALMTRGYSGQDLWRRAAVLCKRTESSVSHRVLRLLGSMKRESINAKIDAKIRRIVSILDLSTLPKETRAILDVAEPVALEAPPVDNTSEPEPDEPAASRNRSSYTPREERDILRTIVDLQTNGLPHGAGSLWRAAARVHGRTEYALRTKVAQMAGATNPAAVKRALVKWERLPNLDLFTLDGVPSPQRPAETPEPETLPPNRANGSAPSESVSGMLASVYSPIAVSTESPRTVLLRDAAAAGPAALEAVARALVAGLS